MLYAISETDLTVARLQNVSTPDAFGEKRNDAVASGGNYQQIFRVVLRKDGRLDEVHLFIFKIRKIY